MLFFFFFNDTATTEIYTLSLHDALPISRELVRGVIVAEGTGCRCDADAASQREGEGAGGDGIRQGVGRDRKSTRLNSSHGYISYAVFCLKKKKQTSTTSPSTRMAVT